jgi:hypothetical protein
VKLLVVGRFRKMNTSITPIFKDRIVLCCGTDKRLEFKLDFS